MVERSTRKSTLVALTLLLGACNSDTKPPAGAGPQPAAPPPAGLVAELVMPNPARVLSEVRNAAGGPAVMLPRTVGGLVANTLGYPIGAAEMVDEQLPIVAATTRAEGAHHWALAVHLRKPDALLLLLAGGKDPPFSRVAAGQASCLKQRHREAPPSRPVGCVLDHYLVIGGSSAAAEHLGRYLVRTVATRKPRRAGDLLIRAEPAAFAEWLPPYLSRWRAQLAEQSWSAKMRSVLDVDALLMGAAKLSKEVSSGEITLNLGATAWHAEARLTPSDDAAWERWQRTKTIEPSALRQLPDDTLVAASWSQRADSRSAQGRQYTALITEGETFDEQDRTALDQALEGLARGRGDLATLGLRCTGVGLTGFASSSVGDESTLLGALDQLVAFAKRDAVTKQLETQELSLTSKKLRMLKIPADVTMLRLQPSLPAGKAATPADALRAIDLRYTVVGGRLLAAAGYEALDTLKLLYAPEPEHTLEDKPAVEAALGDAGERAWMLGYFDPQGLHACRAGKPGGPLVTPVVIRLGPRDDRSASLKVHFAHELVRVLVRELGN